MHLDEDREVARVIVVFCEIGYTRRRKDTGHRSFRFRTG